MRQRTWKHWVVPPNCGFTQNDRRRLPDADLVRVCNAMAAASKDFAKRSANFYSARRTRSHRRGS